eukprot:SAG11_NODE_3731_length_2258_cov_1.651691_2_plen_593_part_01
MRTPPLLLPPLEDEDDEDEEKEEAEPAQEEEERRHQRQEQEQQHEEEEQQQAKAARQQEAAKIIQVRWRGLQPPEQEDDAAVVIQSQWRRRRQASCQPPLPVSSVPALPAPQGHDVERHERRKAFVQEGHGKSRGGSVFRADLSNDVDDAWIAELQLESRAASRANDGSEITDEDFMLLKREIEGEAATQIQSIWRSRRARTQGHRSLFADEMLIDDDEAFMNLKRDVEDEAAAQIQRLWRDRRTQQRHVRPQTSAHGADFMREVESDAATQIQSVFRGWRSRWAHSGAQSARGMGATVEAAEEMDGVLAELEDDAARSIQAQWRGFRSRRAAPPTDAAAAAALSGRPAETATGTSADDADFMREIEDDAATQMQSVFRGWRSRRAAAPMGTAAAGAAVGAGAREPALTQQQPATPDCLLEETQLLGEAAAGRADGFDGVDGFMLEIMIEAAESIQQRWRGRRWWRLIRAAAAERTAASGTAVTVPSPSPSTARTSANKAELQAELVAAAVNGDVHKLEACLSMGANPRLRQPGPEGKTALFIAAEEGNSEAVQLLLLAGADTESEHLGDSPCGTEHLGGSQPRTSACPLNAF